MLTRRVVASLAHGSFFGIGSVVAVVAALGVAGLGGIARLVPPMPRPEGAHIHRELRAFRKPQVLLAMAMTVLGFGGVFAAITYITPMTTHVACYSTGAVTRLLVVFGLGMSLGNLLGGRYADRALMPMLYVALGGLAIVPALFAVTAYNKILAAITILLVATLGFATVPPLQMRVIDQAHATPTLASAVNIGAFNLGNALSAWLGGLVISAGFGCTSPNWVGALLPSAALVLALCSAALERRTPAASRADDMDVRVPVHH